jgi:hypothetical protein
MVQMNQCSNCGLRCSVKAIRCMACSNKHKSTTHGLSTSYTYRSWICMMGRCYCQSSASFQFYGGRGIQVCDRWHKYEDFLSDMGERPRGSTLDRRDNSIGYNKFNCRWVDNREQNKNKRSSVFLTVDGETKNACVWARQFGITRSLLSYRIRSGWSVEDAIKTQPGARSGNRHGTFTK